MGKRGPAKKPTELKLLQGNPGEHKLPKPIKAKRLKTMAPPKGLSKVGKRIWKEVAPKLSELGLLAEVDAMMLFRYCDLFDKYLTAKKFVDEHTTTYSVFHKLTAEEVEKKAAPRLHYVREYPQVAQMSQWARDLTRYEQQFGMSPASRTSLAFESMPKKSHSEVDDLLFGTGG